MYTHLACFAPARVVLAGVRAARALHAVKLRERVEQPRQLAKAVRRPVDGHHVGLAVRHAHAALLCTGQTPQSCQARSALAEAVGRLVDDHHAGLAVRHAHTTLLHASQIKRQTPVNQAASDTNP